MKPVVLTGKIIKEIIGNRDPASSKRDHGRALLIAGSIGFSGAALMAACSAIRCGVGTLKVLTPRSVKEAMYRLPEAMCVPYGGDDWDDGASAFEKTLIAQSTAIGIGPGLGRGAGRLEMVKTAALSGLPTVIDADGLYALSTERDISKVLNADTVITPHFAEMARLCGCSVEEVAENQAGFAVEYAKKWHCTVLLKGSKTAIASYDGRFAWNVTGNSGLAKGGSGDVLTGLVLGFMSQRLEPFDAACAGAYILGASADEALGLLKERFLMARDVTDLVEMTINKTII